MNVFLIILLILVLLLAVYEAIQLILGFIKLRKKNASKQKKKVVNEFDVVDSDDEKGK